MVLLHTPQKAEGFTAPNFKLKGTDGAMHTLESCMGENGLVIAFICNHCPYVIAVIDRFVETSKKLQQNKIGCVAIMPNDTINYPADSFENMKKFSEKYAFTFPYLIDETQHIAKDYDAVCTPDFFGFNEQAELKYRGRLDSAANNPADIDTKPELLDTMLAIATHQPAPENQKPSLGCSIKWKA